MGAQAANKEMAVGGHVTAFLVDENTLSVDGALFVRKREFDRLRAAHDAMAAELDRTIGELEEMTVLEVREALQHGGE